MVLADAFFRQNDCGLSLWRIYSHNLIVSFAAYMIVFIATGFVPMGFVPGSKPLIKAFEPF